MIKFFRKIRQNFLSKGKTGKYFKYAIGEIILVVIGILIALQINTWKESRNNKVLSKTYLQNIKKDLISDTATFSAGIIRYNNSLLLQEDLFNIDKVNSLSTDSLLNNIYNKTIFHSARIYKINNSTYLKLNNNGFIESKFYNNIFLDIHDYYTREYNTWTEYIEWDKELGQRVDKPESIYTLYDKIDFTDFDNNDRSKQDTSLKKEYESIFREYLNSPRFRNYLWSTNREMKQIQKRMKYQKRVASEMIDKINAELKK